MARRTGTTTQQIKAAPKGAIFIWINPDIEYPRLLANKLGRHDLQFRPPSWLVRGWQGIGLTGVVIDHAVRLTNRQREGYLGALSRIRTINKGFDWSLIPTNTIIKLEFSDKSTALRHFAKVDEFGNVLVVINGISCYIAFGNRNYLFSISNTDIKIKGFKNNQPQPWFGGTCPVHPKVKVKIWLKDGDTLIDKAEDLVWAWVDCSLDTIAYQIIDQEIPQ